MRAGVVMREAHRVQLVTLYTRVMLYLAQNPKISQERMARHLEVTMRTVQRHLAELEEEGYILVDRRRKPFEYRIDWSKSCPNIPWLRVVVLHPEVKRTLQGLSEGAIAAYQRAASEGGDASRGLETTAPGARLA